MFINYTYGVCLLLHVWINWITNLTSKLQCRAHLISVFAFQQYLWRFGRKFHILVCSWHFITQEKKIMHIARTETLSHRLFDRMKIKPHLIEKEFSCCWEITYWHQQVQSNINQYVQLVSRGEYIRIYISNSPFINTKYYVIHWFSTKILINVTSLLKIT